MQCNVAKLYYRAMLSDHPQNGSEEKQIMISERLARIYIVFPAVGGYCLYCSFSSSHVLPTEVVTCFRRHCKLLFISSLSLVSYDSHVAERLIRYVKYTSWPEYCSCDVWLGFNVQYQMALSQGWINVNDVDQTLKLRHFVFHFTVARASVWS